MEWIIDNKEWIFSGIGVFVLSFVITICIKKKSEPSVKQNQKSGKNSNNYQSGGDMEIGKRDD